MKKLFISSVERDAEETHTPEENLDKKAKRKNTHLFESDIILEDIPEKDGGEMGKQSYIISLRRSKHYLWIDRVVPYEITPFTGKLALGREVNLSMNETSNKAQA